MSKSLKTLIIIWKNTTEFIYTVGPLDQCNRDLIRLPFGRYVGFINVRLSCDLMGVEQKLWIFSFPPCFSRFSSSKLALSKYPYCNMLPPLHQLSLAAKHQQCIRNILFSYTDFSQRFQSSCSRCELVFQRS